MSIQTVRLIDPADAPIGAQPIAQLPCLRIADRQRRVGLHHRRSGEQAEEGLLSGAAEYYLSRFRFRIQPGLSGVVKDVFGEGDREPDVGISQLHGARPPLVGAKDPLRARESFPPRPRPLAGTRCTAARSW